MTDYLARTAATIAERARLMNELRAVCADLRVAYSELRETNRALVAENEALRARVGTQLTRIEALETLRRDTTSYLESEIEKLQR